VVLANTLTCGNRILRVVRLPLSGRLLAHGLPEDKFLASVSPMPNAQAGEPGPTPEKMPFASWLDSIIPAVIPNDAEFARRVGVDQSYVTRWRRGRRPQVPALVKIADATGTNLETLLRIVGYTAGSDGKSS
jgi:transcriptional regulator with XRE-family HTH domain